MKVKSSATEEDLIRMPKDGYTYELVDGEIVASPSSMYHGAVVIEIGYLLRHYLKSNRLGTLMASDVGFRLSDGNIRCPDLSFVRNEKLPGGVPRTFGECVPDLAVEVLSPSDSARDVGEKIGEYFDCGVRLLWLVDPDTRTVTVFRSLTDARTLEPTDTITGEPVLPSFSCRVAEFFPE